MSAFRVRPVRHAAGQFILSALYPVVFGIMKYAGWGRIDIIHYPFV